MLWTLDMLEHVLELYKSKKLLWQQSHPLYTNKAAREKTFQWIAEQLDVPNLTGQDVNRKLRTMRAAYQVELRNINTGKARGFFYKPTLKWFGAYKKCMQEIEAMKYKNQDSDELSLEEDENAPDTFVLKLKNSTTFDKEKKRRKKAVTHSNMDPSSSDRAELFMEPESSPPVILDDVEYDTNDEFQSFADHIAEQLRSMPNQQRASMIQNQIMRVLLKESHMHEIY